MEVLQVKEGNDTPAVILDKGRGIFEIRGRSLCNDPVSFYRPVIDWMGQYGAQPLETTELVFRLEYVDIASSKVLFDLLREVEKIPGAKAIWYFHEDDEDMEEIGEELAELVGIPFTFKPC